MQNDEMPIGDNANARLSNFIERIECLQEAKAALGQDIKEIYSEIKGVGFDTKIVRKIITRRKLTHLERTEQDDLLVVYEQSLEQLMSIME